MGIIALESPLDTAICVLDYRLSLTADNITRAIYTYRISLLKKKIAFPSVVPECLFCNMHSHQVPEEYINWYKMCMTRKATMLEFDNYCSPLFQIESGINQGCPLSALAFLFYNADILDNADMKMAN